MMYFTLPRLGNTRGIYTRRSDPVYGCVDVNRLPLKWAIPICGPKKRRWFESFLSKKK